MRNMIESNPIKLCVEELVRIKKNADNLCPHTKHIAARIYAGPI